MGRSVGKNGGHFIRTIHRISLNVMNGTGAIRTRDLPLRRRLLYPAELQPQAGLLKHITYIHVHKYGVRKIRKMAEQTSAFYPTGNILPAILKNFPIDLKIRHLFAH